GDQFGATLAAGDFNGDGADELVVGAPQEDIAAVTDAGMIHIIPGKTGLQLQTSLAIARDARSLASPYAGLQAGARFGESLVTGNFNGDAFGVDDLIVGVPHQDIGATVDAGIVAIYDGALGSNPTLDTTGFAFNSQDSSGGTLASNRFGQTFAVGDF